MNLLLLTLHQIAKKFNSLGITARQTSKIYIKFYKNVDLMILLWGLLY